MFNGIRINVLGQSELLTELVGKDINYENAVKIAKAKIDELEEQYRQIDVKSGDITAILEITFKYVIATVGKELVIDIKVLSIYGMIITDSEVAYVINYDELIQNEKVIKTAYSAVCLDMAKEVGKYNKELVPVFAAKCKKEDLVNSKVSYLLAVVISITNNSYKQYKKRVLETLGRYATYLTFFR